MYRGEMEPFLCKGVYPGGGCELGGYWAYLRGSKWRYKSDATLLKD